MNIGVCGHFYFSDDGKRYNGQTVKTEILCKAIEDSLDDVTINRVDTQEVHSRPILFFLRCLKLLIKNQNIIILPAQNGVKVLVPFYAVMNRIFRRGLHYYVVGGWLQQTISKNPGLLKYLKDFTGIYVELESMKKDLTDLGLHNVIYVNKFRDITFLNESEINASADKPHSLCFFSRVTEEKGVEDAVNAVIYVNEKRGEEAFTLDIYGPIDEKYAEKFKNLQNGFPEYIRYKGIVDYNESVQVLRNYYCMLFPTYYHGEGYANVVVDAFAAGLPIIATDWKYNPEVIRDGVDGIIYNRNEGLSLEKILIRAADDPHTILDMKHNVCKRASEYEPKNAIKPLIANLK